MKKRWFTLIEMLIVIVIIGILAWALIPRIWNARDKANDVANTANVNALISAAMQSIIDGKKPCSWSTVQWDSLKNYWITAFDNSWNYKCVTFANDHVIAWYDNMKVDENNNCVTWSFLNASGTASVSTLADGLAVVWSGKNTPKGSGGVYCLVQ